MTTETGSQTVALKDNPPLVVTSVMPVCRLCKQNYPSPSSLPGTGLGTRSARGAGSSMVWRSRRHPQLYSDEILNARLSLYTRRHLPWVSVLMGWILFLSIGRGSSSGPGFSSASWRFPPHHPGSSHNGEDQVPRRIGKITLKPAQEPLKYVTCLSNPEGTEGSLRKPVRLDDKKRRSQDRIKSVRKHLDCAQCSVFAVTGHVSRLALSNHPTYSG